MALFEGKLVTLPKEDNFYGDSINLTLVDLYNGSYIELSMEESRPDDPENPDFCSRYLGREEAEVLISALKKVLDNKYCTLHDYFL